MRSPAGSREKSGALSSTSRGVILRAALWASCRFDGLAIRAQFSEVVAAARTQAAPVSAGAALVAPLEPHARGRDSGDQRDRCPKWTVKSPRACTVGKVPGLKELGLRRPPLEIACVTGIEGPARLVVRATVPALDRTAAKDDGEVRTTRRQAVDAG